MSRTKRSRSESARITMSDIGRLAGVSASTVSRALSNNPAIPESTRERIQQIARAHNYILDTQAQNFRLQRSKTIATVFLYLGESRRMISDPFFMELLGGITDELDGYGYDLLVSRVHAEDDDWCQHYVLNKRVDGLILVDRCVHDRSIERLQAMDAKFVVWGGMLDGQDYVSVGSDSLAGAELAVRHLAAQGRRRIGFVGGDVEMAETYIRRIGYERGLAAVGLPFDAQLVRFTDFSPQAGSHAVDDLLDYAPDIDGLFICSDVMSIAAMEIVRRRGYTVPDDIAIVGYDDIQLAAHCSPRLTTIRQPIHDGGALLVRKLFDLIEGVPTDPVKLPIELVVRDSCGERQGSP
jgi:DNA-binding LacI/PurR family transcriptional regulator